MQMIRFRVLVSQKLTNSMSLLNLIYYRLRDQVLYHSAFLGFFKAIWFGLFEIMVAIAE